MFIHFHPDSIRPVLGCTAKLRMLLERQIATVTVLDISKFDESKNRKAKDRHGKIISGRALLFSSPRPDVPSFFRKRP